MVIQDINSIFSNIFDADVFLDNDGDLRLRLTYLDKNETHVTVTTWKIKINDITLNSYDLSDREINVNISIIPDKLENLLTMEIYEWNSRLKMIRV